MPYENRFVAFIDILGFKNLIDKTANDEKEMDRVLKVLKYTANIEKDNYEGLLPGKDITKEVTVFSDSIVISYSEDLSIGGALFHILMDLVYICVDLLNENIFIRGGVSCGSMYHKDNICFGPAMNRAYILEENDAIYPRIIIDPDAIKADIKRPGSANTPEMEIKYLGKIIKQDKNKNYYLDFLSQYNEFDDGNAYEMFLYNVNRFLVVHLNAGYSDGVMKKYIWFADYFNSTVKRMGFSEEIQKTLIIKLNSTMRKAILEETL